MNDPAWFADPVHAGLIDRLRGEQATWLVTGAAGFIGSNLVEALLALDQRVVGLDNFATGHRRNLVDIERSTSPAQWQRFRFVEGDIRDRSACDAAVQGIDHVLHQAALGSVPWSIVDPLMSHDVNVTGFLNMIDAARRAGVRRFVYAASSSTYGDEPCLPAREDRIGNPLSPYAVTKLVDELYAGIYGRCYGVAATGLRYFNVFGPRQDPDSAYAAVIPRWTASMIADEPVTINGDGTTSRDFCFIANVVQANLRAALHGDAADHEVYNVAVGEQTTLSELFAALRDGLRHHGVVYERSPARAAFQPGDVRHSLADIGKASDRLGYRPTHRISDGIAAALPWYIESMRDRRV